MFAFTYALLSLLQLFFIQNRFEVKRNFIRYISHEIRNPLNVVLIGLQLTLRVLKSSQIQAQSVEDDFMTNMQPLAEGSLQPIAGTDVVPSKMQLVSTSNFGHKMLDGRSNGNVDETNHNDDNVMKDSVKDGVKNGVKEMSMKSVDSNATDPCGKCIEIVEDCLNSCQSAVEIFNDILIYDKIEAGEIKLNFALIDVKSLIEKNIKPFRIQVCVVRYDMMITCACMRSVFTYHE